MLVRNITKQFPIPHEPDQWFVLRRLTHKQVAKAQEDRSDRGTGKMRALGGELVQALSSIKQDETKAKDLLNQYDVDTLLQFGVANWSYEDTFTKEGLDELDPKTAEWAAREILSYSGVGADEEAARKNA